MKNAGINKKINVLALFLPEIKELLAAKSFTELKDLLKNINSIDLAEGWRHLEANEKILLFKLLKHRKAIQVFENLVFKEQSHILNNLENAEISQVINEMAPDERADLFKELPEKISKKLLKLVNKDEEQDLRKLLVYKEGTAGSLMTTDLVELRKDMSARQALLSVQENLRTEYRGNIDSVFITDESHRLLGYIPLQDLLKAAPDSIAKDNMLSTYSIKIDVETDINEVVSVFRRYDLVDAPVVDKNDVLLGVITVDDIMDTAAKESNRELYQIGKMDAKDGEVISYAQATAFELVKRRAGWLVALLMFDFLTGSVLKYFESTLSAVVALTFFIPMLLDTGGNAGNQTAITIIRGLATGDVNPKNVFRIIKVELVTALFIGVIVGAVAFLRALLMQQDFGLSIVVGLTMLLISSLAIATGIFLPLLSKKAGLDPAVLAGPITTSIVDVCGLIIYFKVAQCFIPQLRF